MNSKLKCFLSGPGNSPDETEKIKSILEGMGYEVHTPYQLIEGIDAQNLDDIELQDMRNDSIYDCAHLILMEGWKENVFARLDKLYAEKCGIGISYASELLREHLNKTSTA